MGNVREKIEGIEKQEPKCVVASDDQVLKSGGMDQVGDSCGG